MMEILFGLFVFYVVGWGLARLYDDQAARKKPPYDYWDKSQ